MQTASLAHGLFKARGGESSTLESRYILASWRSRRFSPVFLRAQPPAILPKVYSAQKWIQSISSAQGKKYDSSFFWKHEISFQVLVGVEHSAEVCDQITVQCGQLKSRQKEAVLRSSGTLQAQGDCCWITWWAQTVVSSNCTRRAETKPVDPDPPMLRAWGSPGYPRFTETETKEPQLSEHRLRLVLGTFSI